MAKWIRFDEVGDTGKTKIFEVRSLEGEFLLGEIRWFGRWRKYAFFPDADTIFERDCLMDIADFLDKVMLERRK